MIFVFKTNVSDSLAIKKFKSLFDKRLPNSNWNFDLEDCDKILRVESQVEIAEITINLLKTHGYFCEELL